VNPIGGGTAPHKPGPAESPIRILICDANTLHRQCLATALSVHGMDARGAGDLPSLFEQLDRGVPDVLLLDVGTPDSATLLQVALDTGPEVRVIVTGLTEDAESEIVACAEAGVAGLHLRTESLDELLAMIRDAGNGRAACSSAVSAILFRHVYALVGQTDPGTPVRNPALSAREAQVLRLLEEGLSNQQIASRLNVTIHTVKNHVHSLFAKLGVASRAEAVAATRPIHREAPAPGGTWR
jgi:DNA-binding NarL/FixJ family response regulator